MTGKTLTNFSTYDWLHNGHVTNNNEKMSKSLGNFFTIRHITQRYHPLALRSFLINAHYRSPLNYSVVQLEAFLEALKLVNNLLTMLKKKQQKQQRLLVIQSLKEIEKEVTKVLDVLGLQPPCSYNEVLLQLKDKALTRAGLVEDDVIRLINERFEVRRNKDFLKSDQMRAHL
ncbi:cysteine--tRNA ligase 1, cytoplasmic [Gossypium raimondii]|uniref:cysteine--tRNA ligase 1, cytoplasmic n=1 Tax=Gossypium raimondii TaxID=29730 RepID=UPI00227C3245|nr:cysteine--tRNA ligase 1, cytoplasmic [Gossypium raimondii]